MKRTLFDGLLIALTTVGLAYGRSLLVDPAQSGQQLISGTAATQIFTNDAAASRSYVVNPSTCGVYLVGYSTSAPAGIGTNNTPSISTSTGSYLLQGTLIGATTVPMSSLVLDGPNDAFTGPLWGQSTCTTGTTLTRFRTH